MTAHCCDGCATRIIARHTAFKGELSEIDPSDCDKCVKHLVVQPFIGRIPGGNRERSYEE